ncbi:MAG: hypothetical protein D3923_16330, partial [Candidatus Electrothrix sp. AR3]|nr:hypothetical protein [Candidatus Electrothrix sp. AR3]
NNGDDTYTSKSVKSNYLIYDANNDGTNDLGLEYDDSPSTKRALAEGVDAIEFLYLDGTGASLGTTVADTSEIRAVRVSLLVRATYPDPRYTNTITYEPASVQEGISTDVWDINGTQAGTGNPAKDNFHRRLLISTIKLRNMGL